MHYPLHLTVLCTGLWILQDGVIAAKTAVSSDVLTLFAKNVASVLTSTLLGEFPVQQTNQTSTNHSSSPKRVQEVLSLSGFESIDSEGSKIPLRDVSTPRERYKREDRSSRSPAGTGGFSGEYVTSNSPRYPKYHNLGAYKPYELAVNHGIPEDDVNVENAENIDADTRDNSINGDIGPGSLHYANRFHHPRTLAQPNHYGQLGFYHNYHQTPAIADDQPSQTEGANESPVNGQLSHRPYNLGYQGQYHPYQPQFNGQPGFFNPHGRQQGNGQPSGPGSEQDESNPPRLIDDQNQGQTALPGYGYHSRFHYRPYHDGFYGPPDFYYRPFNGSFNPGPDGGNSSGGQPPQGHPNFNGYGFNPYGPYQQPFYPNFYGHGRPGEPQNPPANSGEPEQAAPENVQADGNATVNGPPYGFPPFGPYYGDYPLHGYPINVGPYHRIGHGFHDYLIPRFKGVPYPSYYPYSHLPFIHPHLPFPGFYPNHKYKGQPMVNGDAAKPEQAEKTAAGNGNSETPVNGDAEVISESKAEAIRSLARNRYEKFPFSWSLINDDDRFSRDTAVKQS